MPLDEMVRTTVEFELRKADPIRTRLLNERMAELGKLSEFFTHLFPFSDLAASYLNENFRRYRHVLIVDYLLALLINEWEDVILELCSGCYPSALRTLRWCLEVSLGGSIATIDGSILDNSLPNRPLSKTAFQAWLKLHDSDARGYPLRRQEVMRALGSPQDVIDKEEKLFADLCKYSHLSERSFMGGMVQTPLGNVVSRSIKSFDKSYGLALRTCDLSIYCIVKAFSTISGMSEEYRGYLENYRFHMFGKNIGPQLRQRWVSLFPRDLPITWKTTSNMIS